MTTQRDAIIVQPQTSHIIAPMTAQEAEQSANDVINLYSGWATALMRVVETKKLYKQIRDKKFLYFEAWQIIGTFDKAWADTSDVSAIERAGEITGYLCRAKILKGGVVVGGASQLCGLDASVCAGKNGSDQHRSAMSAAQTWAASKAFRMLYSSVASLAGYEATTAEEMTPMAESGPARGAVEIAERGFCPVHKAAFQHRVGTSRAGKAFDFWACPEKSEDGSFCKERPQDTPKPAPDAPATQAPAKAHSEPVAQGQTVPDPLLTDFQEAAAKAGMTLADIRTLIATYKVKPSTWAGLSEAQRRDCIAWCVRRRQEQDAQHEPTTAHDAEQAAEFEDMPTASGKTA